MQRDIVAETLETAKAHPAWGMRLSNAVLGGLFFVGGLAGMSWAPLFGLALTSIGAWFLFVAWSLNDGVREAALASRAFDAIDRGDTRDANLLFDAAFEHVSRGARRVFLIHRAWLARNAGDLEALEIHATAAIAVPLGLIARDQERSQRAMAYAARALGRALRKDMAGAMADVERARVGETPSSMALGDLAVVAAEENRRADVRTILNRSDLVDELSGRERQLVRALSRFAEQDKRSIYRHPAKMQDSEAGWMPQATKAADVDPFERAPKRATTSRGRMAASPFVIWGVLVGLFWAIWSLVNGGSHRPSDVPMARGASFAVVVVAVIFFSSIASNLRRAARLRLARAAAVLSIRRGETRGVAVLEAQATDGSPEALLELALVAERESRFFDALARCDVGITRATGPRGVTTFDYTAPSLFAERAFCLAALGRVDEAFAAMEAMPNAVNYAHATRSRLRVRMAIALARGDRTAALAVGRRCGDTLGMTARDAFLIDWLEATCGNGADDAEWARLQRELATKPQLAMWIEKLVPGSQRDEVARRIVASPMEAQDDATDEDSAPAKRTREKGVDA